MVPDNPLTCAEKLAAAHESATLLQASWKLADIVDGALEGAVASTLEDASRHPVAEVAAAELLGASAARHGVEARPWLLRPPHAAKHERNAVLRACDQNVKRALAAKLGTDEKYGEARAALAPALRVAYERHGVLSSKEVDESAPKHKDGRCASQARRIVGATTRKAAKPVSKCAHPEALIHPLRRRSTDKCDA